MTETTEENIKPRAGALGSTIEENMLPKIKSKLKKQAALITNLEAQVSSLTKERDELKHDLGGEIYALQNENNVLKAQVEDLNYRAEEDERTIISHEKEMDALKSQLSNRDKEIEELKGNSEIFYIDPDDPYVEERSSLELAASMVGFNGGPVAELQVYAKKRLPNVFIIKRGCEHKAFTTKEEALASLNKEGEEK